LVGVLKDGLVMVGVSKRERRPVRENLPERAYLRACPRERENLPERKTARESVCLPERKSTCPRELTRKPACQRESLSESLPELRKLTRELA